MGASHRFSRAVGVVVAALAMSLAAASPGAAVVNGGCTAQATASKSGAIDLTTQAEWHVRTDDVISGSGTAPSDQTFVTISAYALGVAVPIVNNTGKGKTGSAGPHNVSSYSWIAKTITGSGSSDSCTGYVTLVIDDVNPLATLAGGGGVAAGVLGLIGMIAVARRQGSSGPRLGGLLAGLLAGVGFGLALQQYGYLDPRNLAGLALPGVGALVGLLSAGSLRRR
jgi:hypothetical protein